MACACPCPCCCAAAINASAMQRLNMTARMYAFAGPHHEVRVQRSVFVSHESLICHVAFSGRSRRQGIGREGCSPPFRPHTTYLNFPLRCRRPPLADPRGLIRPWPLIAKKGEKLAPSEGGRQFLPHRCWSSLGRKII